MCHGGGEAPSKVNQERIVGFDRERWRNKSFIKVEPGDNSRIRPGKGGGIKALSKMYRERIAASNQEGVDGVR